MLGNLHKNRQLWRYLVHMYKNSSCNISTLGLSCLTALGLLATAAPLAAKNAKNASTPSTPETVAGVSSKDAGGELAVAMQKVFPALVRIDVLMEEGNAGRMRKQRGFGSGAIISPEGYIVTNHHVAGRGTRFRVTLSNREEVDATLVGTDALADIAVIKLDLSTRRNPDAPLGVASWGDSQKLKVGDVVLAMGSPGGLSQSVTRGIVANTEMIAPSTMGALRLDGEDVGEIVRWIGHDAVIIGGNSGGPLVNLQGEIIGINEVGVASLGGAIPANLAKKLVAELIAKGEVERSWIGVETQTLLRSMRNGKGVLVANILPGSPAAKAGMQAGDCITHFEGQQLDPAFAPEDLPIFNTMVLHSPIGKQITLKGLRGGKETSWTMTTVKREPAKPKEQSVTGWGITAHDITGLMAIEKSLDSTQGVIVDSMRQGGACAQAKPEINNGDIILAVNEHKIGNLADLQKITASLTENNTKQVQALVSYKRGKANFMTVVRIGAEAEKSRPQIAGKAWLGASSQVLTRELSSALKLDNTKGVRVTSVSPNSPAAKAGLQVGDILTKMDGKIINAYRLEDNEVLANMVRQYDAESNAEFSVLREGKEQNISVTFATSPKSEIELPGYVDDNFELSLQDMSKEKREQQQIEENSGVLVSKVEANGWAALSGLNSGDLILEINGKKIEDLKQAEQTFKDFAQSKPKHVQLKIKRGIRTRFLEIEPNW